LGDRLALGLVRHGVVSSVLGGGGVSGLLGLAEGHFLVLLDEVAENAAASGANVGQTAALEVVALADFRALHGLRNPVQTENGGSVEKKARGVDGGVASERGIFMQAVMGLAKGNTRKTVGHQAGVNGRAAAEETAVVLACSLRTLLMDDIANVREDSVETGLPAVNIIVVDNTTRGVVGRGSLGGHYSKRVVLFM